MLVYPWWLFFFNLICCLQWCLYIWGRTETVAKRTFFLMEIWFCWIYINIYIYIDLLMDIDQWILIEVAEQKQLFRERCDLLKICFVDMHLYIDLMMAIRVDLQILIDVEERKQLPRELFFCWKYAFVNTYIVMRWWIKNKDSCLESCFYQLQTWILIIIVENGDSCMVNIYI